MSRQKTLSILGTSLILIFSFTPAQATSTDVVLNLEGNPTCSSLGDNSAILEFRDSSPDSTPDMPKYVTLNIVDSDGNPAGTQVLEYTVSSTNPPVMDWRIVEVNGNQLTSTIPEEVDAFYQGVNPINYIILKAQGGNNGARVFHFGGAGSGAIADEDEESTGSTLAAASFCYGLTAGFNAPEPPIDLADLPDCEDLAPSAGLPGNLFTTGIICPTEGPGGPGDLPEEQLIINLALNDPRFGFDATQDIIRACTCNTQLKPCNPALSAQRVNDLGQYLDDMNMLILDDMGNPITADDLSQEDRTCLEYNPASFNDRGTPDGVNDRVPFHIEGVENPDSYICYTIDGVRTCYGHY